MALSITVDQTVLLSALGGTIAITLGLLKTLYSKQQELNKEIQEQLDEGGDVMDLLKLQQAIMQKAIDDLEEDYKELLLKQVQDHESIHTIKIYHKSHHPTEEIK